MLFTELLRTEIDNKGEEFARYFRERENDLVSYRATLSELESASPHEINEALQNDGEAGAIPADELGRGGTFQVPFGISWQNHEQARDWAAEILDDRTTFAVDGSQIYAGAEASLPIAAIQVGWFENPHNASTPFEKNARFDILTPEDLLKEHEEPMNPETRVGERRFHAEVAKAAEFISRKAGWQDRGERMPLAFFDGTLLVSFSLPQTSIQESFITALVNLVRHSRDCRVPLVGYVDRSFARDLVSMLDRFRPHSGRNGDRGLYDASILCGTPGGMPGILNCWGGRTCFCYSNRRGMAAFNDPDTGRSLVGFTYLQTTADSPPARLDVPSWIYEEGLLDELADVVRAECVIGLGYPYALETADQTAVISTRDREIFLRALQDFAIREKLGFSVSRKSASKGRRR